MNIDDIKRSLNKSKTPFIQSVPTASARTPYGTTPKEPVKASFGGEPVKASFGGEPTYVNRQFDPNIEEEEIIPNSKSWESPYKNTEDIEPGGSGYKINTKGNINSFIKKANLNDPEDDWRVRSKKGRKSRKRFTKFLVGSL